MSEFKNSCFAGGTAVAFAGMAWGFRVAPDHLWLGALGVASCLVGFVVHHYRRAQDAESRASAELGRIHDERELLIESIQVTPTPFALYDKDDRLIAWNSSYQDLHEPAFSRLQPPIHYVDLLREVARLTLPPEEVESAVAQRLAIQRCADGTQNDRRYPNGHWLRVTKKLTRSGGVAGFATDITELKHREAELAASEARFRVLLETMPAGIAHWDNGGRLLYANPALVGLLGLPGGTTAACANLQALLSGLSAEVRLRHGGAPASDRFETTILTSGGAARDILVVKASLQDGAGRLSLVAMAVDITESRAAQARVEYLATHDLLTDLGNRACFNRGLDAAFQASIRQRTTVSLLAIDLDHFKAVNDRFGHACGDAVLCVAAERMREAARPQDLVCRLGGDEFAMIIEDAAPAVAETVAERILAALARPFELNGHEIHIGVSIGIAVFPLDAEESGALHRCADLALYRVKRRGRCGVARFSGDASGDGMQTEPIPMASRGRRA